MQKHRLVSLVMALALLVLAGCGVQTTQPGNSTGQPAPTGGSTAEEKPGVLRFAAVSAGGTWHLYATTIAKLVGPTLPAGYSMDVLPYAGGAANVKLLDEKKVDIALTFATNNAWATTGTVAYDKKYPQLRGLAGSFADPLKLTVLSRPGAGFTTLDEIKANKLKVRLALYSKGSAGDVLATLLLGEYGITYEDIESWGGSVTHADSAVAFQMMKDKRADLFIFIAGTRQPNLVELSQTSDVNFISISPEIQQQMVSKYGVLKWTYKPGDYEDVKVETLAIADNSTIITTDSLSDEVAYQFVKAMAEQHEDLAAAHASLKSFDPTEMWTADAVGGLPLHPGAERYYKERGWVK